MRLIGFYGPGMVHLLAVAASGLTSENLPLPEEFSVSI
jgi:hypothetical protein